MKELEKREKEKQKQTEKAIKDSLAEEGKKALREGKVRVETDNKGESMYDFLEDNKIHMTPDDYLTTIHNLWWGGTGADAAAGEGDFEFDEEQMAVEEERLKREALSRRGQENLMTSTDPMAPGGTGATGEWTPDDEF